MKRIFDDKVTIRLTLGQTLSQQLIDEIEHILPDNKKLPKPEFVRDGNHFRYKFTIKTKNHESLNTNLEMYKASNPQLDIFAEKINESLLNKIVNVLNLKNLVFPTNVTIRYTLDDKTNPKQFKEELDSYLPDEELPDPTDIGGGKFHRFKINFKVQNTETFRLNFLSFKDQFNTIDINEEYDKRTLKSYVNVFVYSAFIFFTLTRALGYDIVKLITDFIKHS